MIQAVPKLLDLKVRNTEKKKAHLASKIYHFGESSLMANRVSFSYLHLHTIRQAILLSLSKQDRMTIEISRRTVATMGPLWAMLFGLVCRPIISRSLSSRRNPIANRARYDTTKDIRAPEVLKHDRVSEHVGAEQR